MAMCSYAKQSQWIAHILRDMGHEERNGPKPFQTTVMEDLKYAIGSPVNAVQLRGDNQAAISLVKDAHTHDSPKHIDVVSHYIRNLHHDRRIKVGFIGAADMVADGMTKPLQGVQYQRFLSQIGLPNLGCFKSGAQSVARLGGRVERWQPCGDTLEFLLTQQSV